MDVDGPADDMTVVLAPSSALPWFGTRDDQRQAALAGLGALLVTTLYVVVARGFDTSTTGVEMLSLWASLACVWLARLENIWCMPYGLVSVVLLGWYLLDIELVGQGWLQYLYYVPVQLMGWWAWSRGGSGRTELPVTRLVRWWWLAVLGAFAALWIGCWVVFSTLYDSPAYLGWDSSITAASVTAQSLMTWKKRESWWFWTVPVNVSAIGLFAVTEAWAFVFLYVVFLVNSMWGVRTWHRLEKAV